MTSHTSAPTEIFSGNIAQTNQTQFVTLNESKNAKNIEKPHLCGICHQSLRDPSAEWISPLMD